MNKEKMSDNSTRIRSAAFLLSILLHLFLLFLFGYIPGLKDTLISNSSPTPSDNTPEKRLTFELIDTPAAIPEELPLEPTDLASDRSTKASDLYSGDNLEHGLPYSDGISEVKNYPFPQENQPQPTDTVKNAPDENSQDISDDDQEIVEPGEDAILAQLLQKKEASLTEEVKNPEPAFRNIDFFSPDFGGFSFNTYNWDFAPYLLTMKRRIKNNMNLPYAFTNLGAVSGKVLIHFTVLPSGVVTSLDILESDAHYSLEQSSVNAIMNSSAFAPLPADFPEDKLEVTAHFSFTIIK